MRLFSRILTIVLVATAVLQWGSRASAQITVDPSNRYYRNANVPTFFVGYYGWASTADGFFIDHPSRYLVMMQNGAPERINYIRISACVNRFTSTTNPPVWSGSPTPVPFLYTGNPAKADLNQWDSTFWSGMVNQVIAAQQYGVTVHVAIFDGVEIRQQGGAAYGYANSFWNPANQTASFYSNPDFNSNGQIDDSGEFYQLTNFNNNTGIGFYQKQLISKTITTLAPYNNVMYEIGNELIASDINWNTAVFNYIKTLTSRPVTQVGGTAVGAINGWDDHVGDTAAQVKSIIAGFVGTGRPAWIDPDGPGLSDADVSSDELRRAAWYSFAGGAAMWGGFTVDYWSFGHGFNASTVNYYMYLRDFISQSGVQFQNMVPNHGLVSNGGTTNSCIANSGVEYVAYILSDSTANLNLSAVAGTANYRLYDPRSGNWSGKLQVAGGATRTFTKPAGAADWVIYVGSGGPPDSYFVNSDFEGGFGAAGGGYNGNKGNGWTPYTYTGVPSDLTFADETGAGNFDAGAHSQKITAGAGKEGGVYNQLNVINGQWYTISVKVKSGSPAAWCFFGINTSGGIDAHEATGTFYPANNNRSTSWTTFSWTGQATSNKITLFLDTYDGAAYWDTSSPVVVATQAPYGGTAWAIPGFIQAEKYDTGGEGIAYHDLSSGNGPGGYRASDVDVEGCGDPTTGGYSIGFMDAGEWLEYTVNVASAGTYDLRARVATPNNGISFHVEMNGVNVTGTQSVPNTGGWQTWTTKTVSNVSLNAGQQVMRIFFDTGGFNFNQVEWAAVAASQTPFGGTPRTIPGTIQGEDYDNGGEGVAYHDLSAGNNGGQYRADNVDIETTSDTGGGFNVGWIDAGEWLEYTVNVSNTGDHTFKLRVASCCSSGTITLKMNGNTIANARAFDATGGWQTWTTITVPAIFLSAGNNQILQVLFDTGGLNFNKVDVSYGGSDAISEDLGTTNIDDGMTHPICCDGNTTGASIGGHPCRKNVSNTIDRYMYFGISDIYAFQGNRPNVWITVDYYDTGTPVMGLNYDATSNAYKDPGAAVTLTNTNTWKTKSWNVTDGYFGNRENGAADFRIYMTGTSTWYLDVIQVSLTQP